MITWLFTSRKEKVLRVRYWLIRKLIGKMPVAANLRISDYDFDGNFAGKSLKGKPFMFYDNKVYDMKKYLKQEVWTGNKGKVTRSGNTFVLSL
jgi:hypothetical protein